MYVKKSAFKFCICVQILHLCSNSAFVFKFWSHFPGRLQNESPCVLFMIHIHIYIRTLRAIIHIRTYTHMHVYTHVIAILIDVCMYTHTHVCIYNIFLWT
jgi:hypothetical protein